MTSRYAPHPPLSAAVFAILLSLAEGEKHGYRIIKDSRTRQGGNLRLGPGTLYGSIDRMMRDRLVEESGTPGNGRRRYYRLTGHGRAALGAELERLDSVIASARSLGLLAPATPT